MYLHRSPTGCTSETHIYIGRLKQKIIYEGADVLCTPCGMIGYTQKSCQSTNSTGKYMVENDTSTSISKGQKIALTATTTETWLIITFNKRQKNANKKERYAI